MPRNTQAEIQKNKQINICKDEILSKVVVKSDHIKSPKAKSPKAKSPKAKSPKAKSSNKKGQ